MMIIKPNSNPTMYYREKSSSEKTDHSFEHEVPTIIYF